MLDKEIVERSNLLDHLLPGDVIISDRGFTCDEYAHMDLAEVKTPHSLKEKSNLKRSKWIGVENYHKYASMLNASLVS